jgi:hypothetical protein
MPSGEQLGTGWRELHIRSRLVQPQPAQRDRAGEGRAVLVRRPTLLEEGIVDPLDVDAAILYLLARVAICTNLRAAASGSVKWLGDTNFMGSR